MQSWLSTYKTTIVKTLIISVIVILSVCLLFGLLDGTVAKFFSELMTILSPIIIGFVIAYLANPIVMFIEKHLLRWIKRFTVRRLVSTLITLVLMIAFIAFIITMLIPSLISTIESFWDTYIVNYDSSIRSLAHRINQMMDEFSLFDTTQRLDPDALIEWVQEKLPWIDDIVSGDFSEVLPNDPNASSDSSAGGIGDLFTSENLQTIFGYAFSFGTSLFNIIKDTLLGIFVAIYMLMSKERCKAYARRFLNSFLAPRRVRSIVRFGKLLDRSFGGFIEGQLLDAIVVGIVSYFVFLIFNIPIPHLLATIIAVTNVIPIFGPFIGGIPAAILVLLTEPEKLILFVILIVVIQQIDGNVICPHILGDRINISSLATIVAIVTMGGLFGIFGMVIGVPVFAVIIHLVNNYTINALRRKGLETSLKHYYVGDLDSISEGKSSTKKNPRISLTSITELFANAKRAFGGSGKSDKKENNKEEK